MISMATASMSLFVDVLCAPRDSAQLSVIVTSPEVSGQKAKVPQKMKNNFFTSAVQPAGAVCFLLDDQGQMVGESTKWVIGQNETGIEAGATNMFNFVITSPQPFTTTNLTARVSFSRVVLADGKLADLKQDVSVTSK